MTPADLVLHQQALNLTSRAFAKELGVSEVTYSYWRNGKRSMPADIAQRLETVRASNPAQAPTTLGRPKKATYVNQIRDGRHAFCFTTLGHPLSFEDKAAMPPGTLFWLAWSQTAEYDGSTQYEYKRSTIPGHRNHSHPTGNERVPDDI